MHCGMIQKSVSFHNASWFINKQLQFLNWSEVKCKPETQMPKRLYSKPIVYKIAFMKTKIYNFRNREKFINFLKLVNAIFYNQIDSCWFWIITWLNTYSTVWHANFTRLLPLKSFIKKDLFPFLSIERQAK